MQIIESLKGMLQEVTSQLNGMLLDFLSSLTLPPIFSEYFHKYVFSMLFITFDIYVLMI